MSETSHRSPPAQPVPGRTAPGGDGASHDLALLRRSPERLERLFRQVRTQAEGAYLLDLVARYRKQTTS